jgi:DNA recombination protein RmuC
MNLTLQELQPHLPLIFAGLLFIFCLFIFALIFLILQLRAMKQKMSEKSQHLKQYRSDIISLQKEGTRQKVHIAKLVTILKNEKRHASEKLAILESAREKLSLQFQALAQQIFEEKSKKFSRDNKEGLSTILQPLQDQLRSFQKRVDDIQVEDVRDRMSLKKEIIHLRQLNQQVSREAINLTRALKGDKKIQGNWGELVLERVLEQCGLRKGHEYSVQGSFRDNDNRLLKPDVIIHLPDSKYIIIDSKVSLIAWEQYINCEEEKDRKAFLQQHVLAVRNHIKGLSAKDYTALKGVNSLDFVLLFMPIDSSFMAAFEEDEELFTNAFEQRIIVVTPTTLLATLRTIENLWRYERQNQNSKEIAERAGAIYNKMRGFIEDMEKIGKQLGTCTMTYDSAMIKLTKGRGNIVSQASRLTELGVKVKKDLPRSITDLSDPDIPN